MWSHPDSCINSGETKIMSTFEMLPDECVLIIFSYISPQTLEGNGIYQTIGRVSKFFQTRDDRM